MVRAAVVLLNNPNGESPVWAETVNAYAVTVRRSIGIEGDLDAFKVLAKP